MWVYFTPEKDVVLYSRKEGSYVLYKKGVKIYTFISQSGKVWNKIRRMVLIRDNYVCKKCGSKKGLTAHHVIPVKVNPNLAYDIDNMVTLCKKCHAEKHPKINWMKTFGGN